MHPFFTQWKLDKERVNLRRMGYCIARIFFSDNKLIYNIMQYKKLNLLLCDDI